MILFCSHPNIIVYTKSLFAQQRSPTHKHDHTHLVNVGRFLIDPYPFCQSLHFIWCERKKKRKKNRTKWIRFGYPFSIGFKMVISKTCSIQVFQKLFISVDRCLNNLAWLRFQSIFIYAERFNFWRVRSEESPNWHSECKFHIQKSLILQFHMPRIKKTTERKNISKELGCFIPARSNPWCA